VDSESAVFGTFTEDLERLQCWLRERKVRRVVMESTGVYWIPVWNVLERSSWKFDLVLVNPQHVHALPGRKSDQQDCDRLAELGQYDLVRGSFIPPPKTRQLRDLTRRRTHLQADRNRVINRIGRLLETVNIKLGSVVSDLVGKTGWLMLKAIAAGQTNPEELSQLAQGKLRQKTAELMVAVQGYTNGHFRWLLRQLLDDLERLDKKLTEIEARIRTQVAPQAELIQRLVTIPGVQETTAWTILAELGTDMSRFPTAGQAASWAGLCPGQKESAGKRQSGRTRKGNRYLRRMLIQNGWAVAHSKDCFLTALFYRVASRRGLKRAALAVAHRVLIIAYHIIRDGTVYRELGRDYHDRRHPERTAARLTQRLKGIGYEVTLTQRPDWTGRHPMPPPQPVGTAKWTSSSRSSAPVRRRRDRRPPATPEVCPKCARWGISCIHARNALPTRLPHPKSTESMA
jgi:transposase